MRRLIGFSAIFLAALIYTPSRVGAQTYTAKVRGQSYRYLWRACGEGDGVIGV